MLHPLNYLLMPMNNLCSTLNWIRRQNYIIYSPIALLVQVALNSALEWERCFLKSCLIPQRMSWRPFLRSYGDVLSIQTEETGMPEGTSKLNSEPLCAEGLAIA